MEWNLHSVLDYELVTNREYYLRNNIYNWLQLLAEYGVLCLNNIGP